MKMGLDLGSANVKLVWQKSDQSLEYKNYDTFDFYRRFALPQEGSFKLDLASLGQPENTTIVACGYGRQAAAMSGAVPISEIQAHVHGAVWQSGLSDFLLLDLGGQDSKIISVKGGKTVGFSTNDRCAAGSGRYLSNMAAVLGIDLAELSTYRHNPVSLSATCAVFGESELVGEIIKGQSLAALAAGVNYSVVRRILPLLKRHLPAPAVLFSGGVAENQAIRKMLEHELEQEVTVLPQPKFNGAIGCFYW
ncbi:MAG: acyl-CoA dehydratase activase [Bacillota bacterium]|jgi:predicted CoA-substrate-specific enzyme activase